MFSGSNSNLVNLSASLQSLLASFDKNLKITIDGETLVGVEFDELKEGELEKDSPAFVVSKLEDSLILWSYVPDSAKVKDKMLYASAKSTLLKSLPPLQASIFITNRSELSESHYKKHLAHLEARAPMTEREEQIENEKKDEREVRNAESIIYRPSNQNNGLPWSDDAMERLELFKNSTELKVIYFKIDLEKELIIATESEEYGLPSDSACYAIVRIDTRFVFIYSCPLISPIKSRLISSSSVRGVVAVIGEAGIKISKKIETSDPEEVTVVFIENELGPVEKEVSGSDNSKPLPEVMQSFSKPARPMGRKR